MSAPNGVAELLSVKGNFVAGAFAPAASGRTLAVENPATGETIAEIPAGASPDIETAVKPALCCGNSVVLKPSELTSLTILATAKLAVEAGIPAGVFNVVTGLGAEAGAALASHPDVDVLAFTGGTVTGRKILHARAELI